ncbi:MAG: thiamine biosynthesis protein ThiS [Pirellulaceae bacterium]|nr:MAG: thiamine biosynthesis protein ThiS [Pirellulaceae bacterium]GIW91228.1 MAG: thiamine biosynthesis protein ThiS [Pirellulaceae bacterium]GIW93565.1 MAG: thiamine biosynthesis protein ThiS [Pirellulaceae bacterium]
MAEQDQQRVRIEVNGEPMELEGRLSVAELLGKLGLKRYVAVEVNGQVVPRQAHAQTHLCDGDVVELVTLVGGG